MTGAARDHRLVDYLKEARETELALLRALQSHQALASRSPRRDLLSQDVEQTREHVRWVELRLLELGVRPSRRSLAMHRLRSVARQAGEIGARVRRLLTRPAPEDVLLDRAKRDLAIEGRAIANYFAIESLARRVGDRQTAELAAEIRADEEGMLEGRRREIPELAAGAVRAEVAELSFELPLSGGWWAYEELSPEQLGEALARAQRPSRDSLRERSNGSSNGSN
jgi:ferritin-like metal-binding protein YciE